MLSCTLCTVIVSALPLDYIDRLTAYCIQHKVDISEVGIDKIWLGNAIFVWKSENLRQL
jgi:hypothetical protein